MNEAELERLKKENSERKLIIYKHWSKKNTPTWDKRQTLCNISMIDFDWNLELKNYTISDYTLSFWIKDDIRLCIKDIDRAVLFALYNDLIIYFEEDKNKK